MTRLTPKALARPRNLFDIDPRFYGISCVIAGLLMPLSNALGALKGPIIMLAVTRTLLFGKRLTKKDPRYLDVFAWNVQHPVSYIASHRKVFTVRILED
jgi:hypothetical protein